jgi:hypothetical protein
MSNVRFDNYVPVAGFNAQNIVQLQFGYTTTSVSNLSGTHTDTGITATITPFYSTSKILVTINGNIGFYSSNYIQCSAALQRNGSDIFTWNNLYGNSVNAYSSKYHSCMLQYLDSPASTSALTYKLQFWLAGGSSAYTNIWNNNSNPGTICLMEIAQ